MSFQSIVLKKSAESKGISRKAWHLIRKALIALADDPVCVMRIHGRDMRLNLSHSLPLYQAAHDLYDALPSRLAAFLRRRRATLFGVDVGANVGDSIAAFGVEEGDHFLAVEPNPKYHARLQENWPDAKLVTCLAVMCSSNDENGRYRIREHEGTASLVGDQQGVTLQVRRLDSLLSDLRMPPVTILKIDTDGNDFKVLWGAEARLRSDNPAVLFECDAFGSPSYGLDAARTFSMLLSCGYSGCLVYDNLGNYLGRYSLKDNEAIMSLLFYQLTSGRLYYDMLVMVDSDLSDFDTAERSFFAKRVGGDRMRAAEQFLTAAVRGAGDRACE